MRKTQKKKVTGTTVLYRSETNRVIGGVCGGLGEVFEVDPNIIRGLFALATIFGGSGILFYVILWIVIPSQSRLMNKGQDTIRENFEEMKVEAQKFSSHINTGDNSRSALAIILIGCGILFLLNNFGFVEFINFKRMWPLIFILIGFSILMKKKTR